MISISPLGSQILLALVIARVLGMIDNFGVVQAKRVWSGVKVDSRCDFCSLFCGDSPTYILGRQRLALRHTLWTHNAISFFVHPRFFALLQCSLFDNLLSAITPGAMATRHLSFGESLDLYGHCDATSYIFDARRMSLETILPCT